jgi:thiol-disulfide isomerase/thioredoxin
MAEPGEPSNREPFFERPVFRAALAIVLLAAIAGGALAVQWARSDGESGDTGAVDVANAPTPAGMASPIPEAGTGALDDQAPVIGEAAPNFALRDTSGRLVTLSDLRGRVVWVNFWATWCAPCKQELPTIQKLYDEKHGEGLEVVEVNWQDSPQSAGDFWSSMGLSLPIVLDRAGDVFSQYKLRGLPDSFFVDRDGKIAAMYFGFLNEKRAREKLAAAGLP